MSLVFKENSLKRAYGSKFLLGTSYQKPRGLHEQHKVNLAAALLAPSMYQISVPELQPVVTTTMVMTFLGRAQMVTFLILLTWSSPMLHQVIGPFSQAQTRHLSQRRVLETHSVP
ncbi:hypothetical protein ES288_D11G356700v1 [Gossypium darwinii]|uniref:Uncharacterized protein n=1 Tax=Gossypium darwinii TaxID=34276 RepID=A0A5D2AVZ1_GOSDA|nr:hypothetical protein ES288_D11G356700v1 [Gossypium darwinii]